MNKTWIKAAGVRAVKTMAQTAVATIGTSTMITEVDWKVVISATVLSGVLSILTSVKGLPECKLEYALDNADKEVEGFEAEDVKEVKESEVPENE